MLFVYFLVVCIHCFLKNNHFPTWRVWVKNNVNELCCALLEVKAFDQPFSVALWKALHDVLPQGAQASLASWFLATACHTVVDRWRVWPVSSSRRGTSSLF